MASYSGGAIDLNSEKILNVADPTTAQDGATKNYIDTRVIDDFDNISTTKGDLLVRDSALLSRLPVGTNNQVLTADSGETLGVKWSDTGGVFGQYTVYTEDETESSTSSTSFVQKLRLTTASLPTGGNYRIAYVYSWGYSHNNKDFKARVQIDDTTTIHDHIQEPHDNQSAQRNITSGLKQIALGTGTHDIDFDFAANDSSNTATIYSVRIEFFRVS